MPLLHHQFHRLNRWFPLTLTVVQSHGLRSRWDRWLYHGLHSMDLTFLYARRPAWDVLVIALLLGGTALCFTSLLMAWKVIRRKLIGQGELPELVRVSERNCSMSLQPSAATGVKPSRCAAKTRFGYAAFPGLTPITLPASSMRTSCKPREAIQLLAAHFLFERRRRNFADFDLLLDDRRLMLRNRGSRDEHCPYSFMSGVPLICHIRRSERCLAARERGRGQWMAPDHIQRTAHTACAALDRRR
jgi:hypothetical protein